MTAFIYADNVNTTLASSISNSATSLTLASSANLPASIPTGFVLAITLNDQSTRQNFEVIYASAVSGATLSGLLRGQEGTTAQAWNVGDYVWNGITAGQMRSVAAGNLLSAPTVLTASSGTFTPNPAATLTHVIGSSGGGQGGGVNTTGSGQVSVGSGGNAGSYADFWIVGAISGTVSYTCGAGGTGAAPGATGASGGNSTFGTYATLPGGLGGLASTPSPPPFFGAANVDGAAPTLSGVMDILSLASSSGGGALAFSISSFSGGRGANNVLGAASSLGYGTGGNGAAIGQNTSAASGFAGQPGVWIVTEYA